MKMIPAASSGWPGSPPRCTALTSTPIAMAKAAGSTPRSTSSSHHAAASRGAAFGRTAKNFHSLRSRMRRNTIHLRKGQPPAAERGCARGSVPGANRSLLHAVDRALLEPLLGRAEQQHVVLLPHRVVRRTSQIEQHLVRCAVIGKQLPHALGIHLLV